MQERVVQPLRTNRLPASSSTLLQRKCSCGGKCASCSKKRLARKAATRSSRLPQATRIVHNVLLTTGRQLDDATRAELEPRFRHDFSGVRLHTDSQAARSAQAVDALAYTVGRHIVFGGRQYRPETREGRRLLIHELAHVVQQRGAPVSPAAQLEIMPPEAPQEREADQVAERVIQGEQAGLLSDGSTQVHIQRSRLRRPRNNITQNTDSTDPKGPPFFCGVDVTDQVKAAVTTLPGIFSGWSEDDKTDSCDALADLRTGDIAWDIVEMHGQVTGDLINQHSGAGNPTSFCAPCATPGASPPCGSSVMVDGKCHFAGSANYVIFGKMCKLCHDFAAAAYKSHSWYELIDRDHFRQMQVQFNKSGMHSLINLYKKYLPWLKGDSPASNIEAAKLWSSAGYDGWPGAASPAPDRDNCAECSKKTNFASFTVSWYPNLNPYERRRVFDVR